MKLNKGSLFALFAVLELAGNGDRQLSTTDIAEKYGISTHHLAKVMRNLVHSGLVQAVRGVGGGYRFAGNVRRTTLLDVIQLFEKLESELDMPNHGKPGGRTDRRGASQHHRGDRRPHEGDPRHDHAGNGAEEHPPAQEPPRRSGKYGRRKPALKAHPTGGPAESPQEGGAVR